MKGKKKINMVVLIIVASFLVLLVGYRYKKMNDGLPVKFKREAYSMKDIVNLDNIDFKINSVKVSENNLVTLNINIKNKGKEAISLRSIIFNCRILYKNRLAVFSSIEEGENDINGGQESNSVISCKIPYNNIEEGMKFYLPKELYKNKIEGIIDKEHMMYEKYINIAYGDIKQ